MNIRRPLFAILMVALSALCGCSALTSTTNRGIDAAIAIGRGLAASSRASTNASVTEPDVPRYASARVFVASQMPQLRREAAVGHGENIAALARLLDKNGDRLGYWMQAHYASLFGHRHKPETLVATIVAEASRSNLQRQKKRTTS